MNDLVSVIMPMYNAEPFVKYAIESVISQSYYNWELLIIDDCSKDNSAKIAKEYAEGDERIYYLKTERSSGSPCIPRNIGILRSSGRYIAFLDSDDVWLPNKLDRQLPLFDDLYTAIVFSNYEKMNEDGERHNRYIKVPAYTTYQQLLKGNVIGCVTAIFDTQKVGKIFFENIGHEDYVFWLAILKQGFIAKSVNSVTALYRVRHQSISSNKWKTLKWQWNIYVNIEKTGYIKAIYYFCCYAYKAFMKSRK